MKYHKQKFSFFKHRGYEANASILQKTKENNFKFEPEINILKHDILSSDNMKDLPNGNKAVILNPPHGKRIKLSQKPTTFTLSLKNKRKINLFWAVVFPYQKDGKIKYNSEFN